MPIPPMGNGVNDRRTPRDLFDKLNEEFDFTLDGAASHENALCDVYCTLEGTFERCTTYLCPEMGHPRLSWEDGLHFSWEGERVYINPPYGRGLLEPFIRKAATSRAEVVVALIPVRTEQPWFHEYVWGWAEIRFLKGRVKYDGLGAAPFPSMVVIWRGLQDNSQTPLLEIPGVDE